MVENSWVSFSYNLHVQVFVLHLNSTECMCASLLYVCVFIVSIWDIYLRVDFS